MPKARLSCFNSDWPWRAFCSHLCVDILQVAQTTRAPGVIGPSGFPTCWSRTSCSTAPGRTPAEAGREEASTNPSSSSVRNLPRTGHLGCHCTGWLWLKSAANQNQIYPPGWVHLDSQKSSRLMSTPKQILTSSIPQIKPTNITLPWLQMTPLAWGALRENTVALWSPHLPKLETDLRPLQIPQRQSLPAIWDGAGRGPWVPGNPPRSASLRGRPDPYPGTTPNPQNLSPRGRTKFQVHLKHL